MKAFRHLILLLPVFALHVVSLRAQTVQGAIQAVTQSVQPTYLSRLQEARSALLAEDFKYAETVYREMIKEGLKARDAVSGVAPFVISEYAYALALEGVFEGALIEVDRARSLGDTDFFASEILELLEYPELAQYFRNGSAPEWLGSQYLDLRKKYSRKAALAKDDPQRVYERALTTAGAGQSIYALVLLHELSAIYPSKALFPIQEGVLMEKEGNMQAAVQQYKAGLALTDAPDDKAVLNAHITSLYKQQTTPGTASKTMNRILGRHRYIAYAGGTFAKGIASLDTRVGLTSARKYSATLNLGFAVYDKQKAMNIGISAYKTYGVFMVGAGVTERLAGKGNSLFSITPSAGLSIPDADGSGSYDIVISYNIPCKKGVASSYGISLGRTFYFYPKKKQ